MIEKISLAITQVVTLVNTLPNGREKSLAITKLDEARLWVREIRLPENYPTPIPDLPQVAVAVDEKIQGEA